MRIKLVLLALFLFATLRLHAQDALANNTILIVRHAEKPLVGTGLTARGEDRANLYAHYFLPFREEGLTLHIDSLYAGADSANSVRPRLTLEPLAKSSGLPLHHDIGTKDTDAFVLALRSTPHGLHPLVSWRHGEIPNLVRAFGGDPGALFPGGKWPDDVFDWVVLLKTDNTGKVVDERLIHEHLNVTVAP